MKKVKNKKIPIVAIDTNRINLRQKLPSMNKLEKWHKSGKIKLVLPGSTIGEIRDYSEKALKKTSLFHRILSPAHYGSGVTYGNLVYGSPEPEFSLVKKILFEDQEKLSRNKRLDMYHLVACLRNKVDYFITNDAKHILSKRKKLLDELGMKVLSSDELIEELKNIISD